MRRTLLLPPLPIKVFDPRGGDAGGAVAVDHGEVQLRLP